MSNKYEATFWDGKTIKRTTQGKVYTYAWRAVYMRPFDSKLIDQHGFSGDINLAMFRAMDCAPYIDRKRWIGESRYNQDARIAKEEIARAQAIASRMIEIIRLEDATSVYLTGVREPGIGAPIL